MTLLVVDQKQRDVAHGSATVTGFYFFVKYLSNMKYYVNVIFVLLDRTFFCWRDTKTFRRHFGQISVVDAVMAHSADERYL